MEQITELFGMVAKFGAVVALVVVVLFIGYVRWRASGQERGI